MAGLFLEQEMFIEHVSVAIFRLHFVRNRSDVSFIRTLLHWELLQTSINAAAANGKPNEDINQKAKWFHS